MSSKKKKFWGLLPSSLPANAIGELAKQQESLGLEGTFAVQVYGPPFAPLAAAAGPTSSLKLATGIAIALTRSPFETAMATIELDHMTEGRFILGLGASVKSWTNGFFGMPYSKPVSQLREAVEVIRKVTKHAHKGSLENHIGTYYKLDFSELQPTVPPLRENIPIWISALRGPMTRLGAEIGDGIIGHPIWTIDWLRTHIRDEIVKGLNKSGRQRSEIEINCWFWTTPNSNRKESVEDARAVVAFYAGIEQYEPFFEAHGFGEICKQLQEGVKNGSYLEAAHLIPDDMASTFVLTGTPDEVKKRLEPAWEIADSVTLVPPALSLPPEKTLAYTQTIGETFYSDT